MMKKILILLCLLPTLTAAQVSSTSQATAASVAGANNTGNAQSITFQGPNRTDFAGAYSLKSVGNAAIGGFSSSFSTDYCGGTTAGSVAGMGFGIALGAPKIDPSCVMLRTFERTMQAANANPSPEVAQALRMSAIEILASIDPIVRKIFVRNGLIDEPSIIRVEQTNEAPNQ